MSQYKSDIRIHLSDGDIEAASKLIREVRRNPVDNSLHRHNLSRLLLGIIIGVCVSAGLVMLVLSIFN
jgi:hypothetical protein